MSTTTTTTTTNEEHTMNLTNATTTEQERILDTCPAWALDILTRPEAANLWAKHSGLQTEVDALMAANKKAADLGAESLDATFWRKDEEARTGCTADARTLEAEAYAEAAYLFARAEFLSQRSQAFHSAAVWCRAVWSHLIFGERWEAADLAEYRMQDATRQRDALAEEAGSCHALASHLQAEHGG